MKTLKYEIVIDAPSKVVWEKMLGPESYQQWAKAFSPNSQYRGEWKQGSYINFIDPNMGGTRALLESVIPYQKISAKHVAMLDKGENEDNESDFAKKWIGTTEDYTLSETEGKTHLAVVTKTDEAFEKMFTDSWPQALQLLKEICEKK